jgi:hypothetical protein
LKKFIISQTSIPFDPKLDADEAPPRNWKSQLRKFSEQVLPGLQTKN